MKRLLTMLTFALLFGSISMMGQTIIFDFEDDGLTTEFGYFGSSLEGSSMAAPIDNPNPNAGNSSAKVLEYVKAAGAQTWAGAFAVNAPTIDVTAGGQICVKVHMDHIGNIALKLEASPNDSPNWILTQPNTVINDWEEICFNLAAPSIEDPFGAAEGAIYGQLVFFVDFGTSGADVDVTTYLDDFIYDNQGVEVGMSDVTFSLNGEGMTGFTQPYVSGEFNGWSGTDNPLTYDENTGVWSTTLPLDPGPYEYKFTFDDWNMQESFSGPEECTKMTVNSEGVFVNRILIVGADDVVLPIQCFNSCYNCGEGKEVTIELGMNGVEPDSSGVYMAGGAEFGAPSPRFQLKDEDGDGVYSITFERLSGFASHYTFTNGLCGDFSCKENIAGQDCSDPDNFDDRFMEVGQAGFAIATCYGVCSDNVNCVVGIEEDAKAVFSMNPTMTNGLVNIELFTQTTDATNVQIFNAAGQMVQQVRLAQGTTTHTIDLSEQGSGVYFVSLQTAGKAYTQRVVKF